MAVVSEDCSVEMVCGACDRACCVGCGQATVYRLDDDQMTCRWCDPEFCLPDAIRDVYREAAIEVQSEEKENPHGP